MPLYAYICPNGHRFEQYRPADQCRVRPDCPHCGRTAWRDIITEHGGKHSAKGGGWPLRCRALGCLPRQAREMYEDSVRRGVPTMFDKHTGEAIFEDSSHYRRYLKAYGVVNYDSYGGLKQ